MVKAKKHTHYHKDGSIWARGALLGKKMHGYWVWFRKDGSKMRSGHFDKNKQIICGKLCNNDGTCEIEVYKPELVA